MTLRFYSALALSVSAAILCIAGFLALRFYLLRYSLVCGVLAMFAFHPVAFSVTMISMVLIGQAVFVFYYYPLISVQSAASVAGAVIGSLLIRWSLPRLAPGQQVARSDVLDRVAADRTPHSPTAPASGDDEKGRSEEGDGDAPAAPAEEDN